MALSTTTNATARPDGSKTIKKIYNDRQEQINSEKNKKHVASAKAKSSGKNKRRGKYKSNTPTRVNVYAAPHREMQEFEDDDHPIYKNELNQHDVLVGRGNPVARLPGNLNFRNIVWENRPKYLSAHNSEKSAIAASILKRIANLDPPGRVYEMADPNDDNNVLNRKYVTVPMFRAIEKACQALRERKATKPHGYEQYRREKTTSPQTSSSSPSAIKDKENATKSKGNKRLGRDGTTKESLSAPLSRFHTEDKIPASALMDSARPQESLGEDESSTNDGEKRKQPPRRCKETLTTKERAIQAKMTTKYPGIKAPIKKKTKSTKFALAQKEKDTRLYQQAASVDNSQSIRAKVQAKKLRIVVNSSRFIEADLSYSFPSSPLPSPHKKDAQHSEPTPPVDPLSLFQSETRLSISPIVVEKPSTLLACSANGALSTIGDQECNYSSPKDNSRKERTKSPCKAAVKCPIKGDVLSDAMSKENCKNEQNSPERNDIVKDTNSSAVSSNAKPPTHSAVHGGDTNNSTFEKSICDVRNPSSNMQKDENGKQLKNVKPQYVHRATPNNDPVVKNTRFTSMEQREHENLTTKDYAHKVRGRRLSSETEVPSPPVPMTSQYKNHHHERDSTGMDEKQKDKIVQGVAGLPVLHRGMSSTTEATSSFVPLATQFKTLHHECCDSTTTNQENKEKRGKGVAGVPVLASTTRTATQSPNGANREQDSRATVMRVIGGKSKPTTGGGVDDHHDHLDEILAALPLTLTSWSSGLFSSSDVGDDWSFHQRKHYHHHQQQQREGELDQPALWTREDSTSPNTVAMFSPIIAPLKLQAQSSMVYGEESMERPPCLQANQSLLLENDDDNDNYMKVVCARAAASKGDGSEPQTLLSGFGGRGGFGTSALQSKETTSADNTNSIPRQTTQGCSSSSKHLHSATSGKFS
ncbi:hypothetical protein ACA910_004908 [Epithemia clementina (nom. ined.)]